VEESPVENNQADTVEHVTAFEILQQIDSLEKTLDHSNSRVTEKTVDVLSSRRRDLRLRSYRQLMAQIVAEKSRNI
jgi:hypothetical protein